MDIKIFVSHRIDIKSQLVNNPIFQQVRCGAAFDKQNPMNIAGDDTLDNISEKRLSFCEFTVQYWAWKNAEADYYGLCHYRRFLSFASKRYKTNEFNMIFKQMLLPSSAKKFNLTSFKKMKDMIEPYDIVALEPADVRRIYSCEGYKNTVRELWLSNKGIFFEEYIVDLLFELIKEFYPEFLKSAAEYFDGIYHRGYNCFVMKKDLFYRMCKFQFDIMFEAEKRIDTTGYTTTMHRTPAFMGEMLFGIFVYHVTKYENVKIKDLQLIFFSDTSSSNSLIKNYAKCFIYWFVHLLGKASLPFFPYWSKRREVVKKIIYAIFRVKNRGVAEPKKEQ